MADQKTAAANAKKPKKARKNVLDGIAHIHASFNNTIVTITDRPGKYAVLGDVRWQWLPRIAEEHAVCRPGGG